MESYQALTSVIAAHEELRKATDKNASRIGLASAPEGIPDTWQRPEMWLFGGQKQPIADAKERFSNVWYIISQLDQFKGVV